MVIIAYWNEGYINALLPARKKVEGTVFRNLNEEPITEENVRSFRKYEVDICPSNEEELTLSQRLRDLFNKYGVVYTRKNIQNLNHCCGAGI